jgi:hypothetical protein
LADEESALALDFPVADFWTKARDLESEFPWGPTSSRFSTGCTLFLSIVGIGFVDKGITILREYYKLKSVFLEISYWLKKVSFYKRDHGKYK